MLDKLPTVKEFEFAEVTNSARSTFTNCRKKFYWQYICRLTPNMTAKALMIGSLFHAALETIYKELQYNKEEMDMTIDKGVEEKVNECSSPEESDILWNQAALIKGLVEGYAKHYLAQDKKTWKIIAPETTFAFPLKNGWLNRGMRDLLITRNGKLGLVEHKTTTILDANYLAKLPMDSQILSYAISCKREKSIGKYPDFIVYNVARKAQIRQKQSENSQQFHTRMRDEYLMNPTAYFYREVLSFNKSDLEAYENDLEKFAAEMQRSIKEKYYYCNYGACTQWGTCPYMQLCQAKKASTFNEAMMSYRVKDVAHEELET